ncbi:MAG: hypothetical protein HWN68_11425 [Desulfobacterales bacterium]|nr:hypothetical protein [Desulfobacterales bacterium]
MRGAFPDLNGRFPYGSASRGLKRTGQHDRPIEKQAKNWQVHTKKLRTKGGVALHVAGPPENNGYRSLEISWPYGHFRLNCLAGGFPGVLTIIHYLETPLQVHEQKNA